MNNKKCPCCENIGGPHWGINVCPKCGKKEKRYYSGSWDWEPKTCLKCQFDQNKIIEELVYIWKTKS